MRGDRLSELFLPTGGASYAGSRSLANSASFLPVALSICSPAWSSPASSRSVTNSGCSFTIARTAPNALSPRSEASHAVAVAEIPQLVSHDSTRA